ncbi:alpha/beta hydrolase [Mumia zhuanghuii]|uniref:Alpha/beta hydrolase family protein n=2 Tax=Mumia TaxID=1546255 RepID=A0ABW1QT35_9ACTN|nr:MULTISPECIES: alpha/beta hydrolase [Mumia]KAA1420488.1 alpha/beta hydrolase [Mumia zhuanghuii]
MTDPALDRAVLVRAVRTAVRVPSADAPYDTAHVTVRYPALPAQNTVERMSGRLQADATGAPYPVAVLLSGINVGADAYAWLAVRLVEAGFVAVTYDWVGELFPATEQTPADHGLTPGVDIGAVGPDTYGTRPTTPALRPVLDAVAALGEDGPLAGMIDTGAVALFGHSAGGTVALQSARPAWFPEIRAVATYAAHTMASQMLGHPPSTLLPAPVEVPVLLAAGTSDGVVAASAVRYGEDPAATDRDPITATWSQAVPATTEAWLVHLDGATHMLAAHPQDPSTARGFLEGPPTGDADAQRDALATTICTFFAAHVRGDAAAKDALELLAEQPRSEIAEIRRR